MKRKTLLLIFALALSAVYITPGGASPRKTNQNPNEITKDFSSLRGFTGISLAGSHNVEYRQSRDGSYSVAATGHEEDIRNLVIQVSSNNLRIAYKDRYRPKGRRPVTVVVTSPNLMSVAVAGSGDVRIYGELITKGDFTVRVSGSGDIVANRIECRNYTSTVSGSGDSECNYVTCENFTSTVSGSGDADFGGVTCRNANIRVAGSGDTEISELTADNVKMSVAGSGDISVTGRVLNAEYTVAGSGGIEAESLKSENANVRVSGNGTVECNTSQSITAHVSSNGTIYFRGNPAVRNLTGKTEKIRSR